MANERFEPFQVALASLRERLREGVLPPGERIAAADVAADLRLSATPVREALSRLAGEGLLEDRRGQGFFDHAALTAVDIADLYGASMIRSSTWRTSRNGRRCGGCRPRGPRSSPSGSPIYVRVVERLFFGWIAVTGSAALITAHRATQVLLGPVRRAEPKLVDDLAEEAAELRGLDPRDPAGDWVAVVRRFHERRIALADRLAGLLDPNGEGAEYSSI